jgi:transcription elongation factor Elf1
MSKPKRACPVCKECGTHKFTVVSKKNGILILECNRCFARIELVD